MAEDDFYIQLKLVDDPRSLNLRRLVVLRRVNIFLYWIVTASSMGNFPTIQSKHPFGSVERRKG